MTKIIGLSRVMIVGGMLAAITITSWIQPPGAAANAESQRPWTILVYGAVDNSADGDFVAFLDKVRRAIDDDPGIELLALIDRKSNQGEGKDPPGFLDIGRYAIRKFVAELSELREQTDLGEDERDSQFKDIFDRAVPRLKFSAQVLFYGHKKPSKKESYFGGDFSDTRLYRVHKDSVERLGGGKHLPEIAAGAETKLNSADAATLGRFIAWGKEIAPARRYALLIYSHANGRIMCPVEPTGAEMGIAELTEEIGPACHVDFLALELCQMGGIEIAYQWRPDSGRFGADVLLAIPNAGPPLDWDRAFARLRSPGRAPVDGSAIDPATLTAADFGRLVVEEGLRGRQTAEEAGRKVKWESAACYDLRAAADVKKAVDSLAAALAKSDSKDSVLSLRDGKKGGKSAAIHYSRSKDYVDLYDLCRRLESSADAPDVVRAAAQQVTTAVKGRFMLASFGMSGYAGFEAGGNGVFIVLPSGKPDCWKEFAWYTPLAGNGEHFGRWSFLSDGATRGNGVVENWFELMDSWFDTQDEQGGINGYRP